MRRSRLSPVCRDFCQGKTRLGLSQLLTIAVLSSAQYWSCVTASNAPTPVSTTVATSTTSTTTTSTSPNNVDCGGLDACIQDTSCRTCLGQVGPYGGHVASTGESGILQRRFFEVLRATSECSVTSTRELFPPAIRELRQTLNPNPCRSQAGFGIFWCQMQQYYCFLDANCSACLAAVYTGAQSSDEILLSLPCLASAESLVDLVDDQCYRFPQCSYSKLRCTAHPACAAGLALLNRNEGALAAQQCPVGTECGLRLSNTLNSCSGAVQVGCDYWLQHCMSIPGCGSCLEAMGDRQSISLIVAASHSSRCSEVMRNQSVRLPLLQLFEECPAEYITPCITNAAFCILDHHPYCGNCLDGTAEESSAACQVLLNGSGYAVTSLCTPCSESVFLINRIVLATSIVGGTSVFGCFLVMVVIVAYSRDRVSMRDRIVLGLITANAIYSISNAMPMNALKTGVTDCGQLRMSFEAIRLGRSWWFAGKYSLVGFEMLILGTSIWALSRGARAFGRHIESTCHIMCLALGLGAFVGFYLRCADINAEGYNAATQSEAVSDRYNHLSTADDLDDDNPRLHASAAFVAARDKYDALMQLFLQVWTGLLIVAMMMWVYLRWSYHHLVDAWQALSLAETKQEIADAWADTRRSLWRARREVLVAQREAYSDVAKPLELYVAVFVLFGVPAIMMSTDYCQNHSGADDSQDSSVQSPGFGKFTYRTCDVWCEFVLAFRSLATVVVYFLPRQRRNELLDLRRLTANLCTRLGTCWTSNRSRAFSITSFSSLRGNPILTIHGDSRGRISEDEIRLTKTLARGAFGVVWEGAWVDDGSPIAVKILGGNRVDSEGDSVDDYVEQDFENECAMLRMLNHPNLLRFYGFGVNKEGQRFIVTELMALGSLRGVLLDCQKELPWPARSSIALQIAKGMDHLHSIPIVHRDLKSANVLLNEALVAKIADFGSSKQLRPRPPQMVHASYTGTRVVLPMPTDISKSTSQISYSHGVTIEHGTMTRAVGTLLWMSPEQFRGDSTYGWQVDVYSYGIILYEIATRQTPWNELSNVDFPEFFERLSRALQTGQRPRIPDILATERPLFVGVMKRCWASDPEDRPPFSEVVQTLHDIRGQTSSRAVHSVQNTLAEPLLPS